MTYEYDDENRLKLVSTDASGMQRSPVSFAHEFVYGESRRAHVLRHGRGDAAVRDRAQPAEAHLDHGRRRRPRSHLRLRQRRQRDRDHRPAPRRIPDVHAGSARPALDREWPVGHAGLDLRRGRESQDRVRARLDGLPLSRRNAAPDVNLRRGRRELRVRQRGPVDERCSRPPTPTRQPASCVPRRCRGSSIGANYAYDAAGERLSAPSTAR